MAERNAVFDQLRPKLNYKLSVAVAVYNDNVRIRIQTDSSENWQEIITFLDDQVEENNQLSLKNRAENKEDEGIVHDYGLVKMNNDGFTYFFDLGSTNDAFFDYILLSLNKYKNIVKAKIY